MITTKFLPAFVVLLLLAFIQPWQLSLAKDHDEVADIPEVDGTYDVPGRTGLKVRVFVHRPRPAKPSPQPTPTPSIVCYEDLPSTAQIPGAGWKLPATWTYTLNVASVPASVGADNWPVITANSFKSWTDGLTGNPVTIHPASAYTALTRYRLDGQNIVTWGRISGSAIAVSYIWYYPGGEAVEVDTIMNQKYPWYWQTDIKCTNEFAYDAQNILTHELGHSMGLDDVYTGEFVNNTMYGYGSLGETKKSTLTDGDITGVNAVYGP